MRIRRSLSFPGKRRERKGPQGPLPPPTVCGEGEACAVESPQKRAGGRAFQPNRLSYLITGAGPACLVGLNTFDRHLLREWLSILGLTLVLMCGLLLVQVMYNDFRDLRDAGAGARDLAYYLIVTVPSFLALTLPIVLLASTLFVLGKLHKNNE